MFLAFMITPTLMPQLEVLEDRIAPATLLVSNLNDDGAGSLREAINKSNVDPGKDTIVFAKHLAGTLSLESALPTIEGSLSIKGPGAVKLTIDGGGEHRILNIDDGNNDALKKVSISGLSLSHGEAGEENGGAILNKETLSLNKCVIANNKAYEGGGIYTDTNGTLTLQKTDLIDNIAMMSGGGLSASAEKIKISNSKFYGNTAHDEGTANMKIVSEEKQFAIFIDGTGNFVKSAQLSNHSFKIIGGAYNGITVPTGDFLYTAKCDNLDPTNLKTYVTRITEGKDLTGKYETV